MLRQQHNGKGAKSSSVFGGIQPVLIPEMLRTISCSRISSCKGVDAMYGDTMWREVFEVERQS